MQRKATKQSPSPPAGAHKLVAWIKDRGICAACGAEGGVIAHHSAGASAKICVGLERVYIGPWFILGLCQRDDDIVTHQSRRDFRLMFGPESKVWARQIDEYETTTGEIVPDLIKAGIAQWAK